jgi:hypothetical protein
MEEGMGDHSDLPICRKFLQLGRLHEQSQPLQQLDEVIEDIRRLMVESGRNCQRGEAEQKKRKQQQHRSSNNNREMER